MPSDAPSYPIVPHRITGGPNPDTPRYWFDNHPFKTHVFNALSSTFPEGERFFVRSVRHYREWIGDVALAEQVRQFTSQEGYHGIEHDRHIEILRGQGYEGLDRYIRFDKRILNWINRSHPLFALAATAAIEHFTAIMANQLLSHPERWIEPMHPDMHLLWQWHAAEETEHKAVAYDVYQRVSGSYGIRIGVMVLETAGLLADVFFRSIYFLYRDGLLVRPRLWFEGWRFVWGRTGVFGSLWKDYWRYYRRNFHPWDCDNYHLVAEFLQAHERSLKSIERPTTAATSQVTARPRPSS